MWRFFECRLEKIVLQKPGSAIFIGNVIGSFLWILPMKFHRKIALQGFRSTACATKACKSNFHRKRHRKFPMWYFLWNFIGNSIAKKLHFQAFVMWNPIQLLQTTNIIVKYLSSCCLMIERRIIEFWSLFWSWSWLMRKVVSRVSNYQHSPSEISSPLSREKY